MQVVDCPLCCCYLCCCSTRKSPYVYGIGRRPTDLTDTELLPFQHRNSPFAHRFSPSWDHFDPVLKWSHDGLKWCAEGLKRCRNGESSGSVDVKRGPSCPVYISLSSCVVCVGQSLRQILSMLYSSYSTRGQLLKIKHWQCL